VSIARTCDIHLPATLLNLLVGHISFGVFVDPEVSLPQRQSLPSVSKPKIP